MKKYLWINWLLACLAGMMIWTLSGCGTARQEAAESLRSVTDDAGTVMNIPVHPQRVILLNPSNVDLYCAAGGAAAVSGISTTSALSQETAALMKDVPSVGIIHQPDTEKILSLHPDLVIAAEAPENNGFQELLRQSGIPVYRDRLSSYDDIFRVLRFFGQLTGQEQTAEKAVQTIQTQYDSAVGQSRGQQPVKALILLQTPKESEAGTSFCFAGDLLKRLGAQNIADGYGEGQPYILLSMEHIAEEAPDVILIIRIGSAEEGNKDGLAEMQSDPAWSGLAAVQNGRVYTLPHDLFSVNPGTRTGEAVKILADDLYGRADSPV